METLIIWPEKTADSSRCHHWFPHKMTSENWPQKFHAYGTSPPRSGKCFWLVESNFPCCTTNQNPDLGNNAWSVLDCEQSLVFFRFSESNARARGRRSRQTRETRAAAREENRVSLFSCLSRLAPSVTRVAICVSRVLLDGLQKKVRLLVV